MSESDSGDCTPPDILEAASNMTMNLLPAKSRSNYNKCYHEFMEWKMNFGYGYTVENFKSWIPRVARLIVYFLFIKGCNTAFDIIYKVVYAKESLKLKKSLRNSVKTLSLFGISVATLIYFGFDGIYLDDKFAVIFLAYLLSEYSKLDEKPEINYGVGMACSFFEGYLILIIPSDGSSVHVGFEEKIKMFEDEDGVLFPVRRLFIVITKSLFCPSDMKQFNKNHRSDLAYIEAVKPLDELVRDVAGVKGRIYRNSVYKICRPGNLPPVYICTEFATPLHTLSKVLDKRVVYDKLCDIDKEEIVEDFCRQLKTTIDRSPECRGKCELVHYDDTDPSINLADVLLDAVEKIEPNFDELLEKHRKENPVDLN